MKYIIIAVGMVFFASPLSGVFAQDNPFAANAPGNPFATAKFDRYAGVFQSDAVHLTLVKAGDEFSGELYYVATNMTYPVKGTINGDKLTGVFAAGGANFTFTFALNAEGPSGVFETEGFNGTLTRVGVIWKFSNNFLANY